MIARPDIPSMPPAAPERRLALAGLLLVPLLVILAPSLRGLMPALLAYGLGLGLAMRAMAQSYPHGRIGWCNLVTTARLSLVAAIAAIGIDAVLGAGAPGWEIFALASVALALDGVDGFAARRQGLSSGFGARYDMEVDAALAATLAVLLLATGRAGAEVLVLGFARYVFVLATLWRPWLGAPLQDSLRRKAICVLQIGTLAALTAPVFPEAAVRPLTLVVAALLLWSFTRDIRWLAPRR